MSTLLILGTAILAVDPIETADQFDAGDIIYPKSTIAGYELHDASLPDGFTKAAYAWVSGALALKEVASPSPIVPDSVERLQARLQLISMGLWDLVQPAIDVIADDMTRQIAQAYFEDANPWNRTDAFVLMLAPALGLDDAGLDAAFIAAAKI